MKILIINGANLNNLGKRDKTHYGNFSLKSLRTKIEKEFPKIRFDFFSSNIEGEIINKIQEASNMYDGLIINPGGYAHTSVAIRDALEEIPIIKIEVHLSNIYKRESFRQNLLTAQVCDGYITGFKENSYLSAIYVLTKMLSK